MTPREFAQRLADRLGVDRRTAMDFCKVHAATVLDCLTEGEEVPILRVGKLFLIIQRPRKFRIPDANGEVQHEGKVGYRAKLRFKPAVAFYRRLQQEIPDDSIEPFRDL